MLIDRSDESKNLLLQQLEPLKARVILASGDLNPSEMRSACPLDLILFGIDSSPSDQIRQLIRLLRSPWTSSIPLVPFSSSRDPVQIARCLDLGAVDFLTLPCDPTELLARIRTTLRAKFHQDRLRELAQCDPLTGLGNRMALKAWLSRCWDQCRRERRPIAAWVADLDHFKRINDQFGHKVGDDVLRHAAQLLQTRIRSVDFAGRLGGEEFLVLAPGCDLTAALPMADRFRRDLATWKHGSELAGHRLTVSLGIAAVDWSQSIQPTDLIHEADMALYAAKHAGRNQVWRWDLASARPRPAA